MNKTNKTIQTGIFCISLDFELNWGIFEKNDIDNRVKYFNNTLKSIPETLYLFEKYNIHATWASVGFLFFKNKIELLSNIPNNIPKYQNKKVSSYEYIRHQYNNKFQAYHFAPHLIKKIQNTTGQEIGTHTLSHYYCLEPGQTPKDFKNDLLKHKEIAKKFGIQINSLVFPRNQHNKTYERIVEEIGIVAIRTNPDIWFWNSKIKENLFKKIFRTLDAYIPLFDSTYKSINLNQKVIKIPASRFFRPLNKYNFLNKLRIIRIKQEMKKAAKKNKIYHLWWHPHNFGNNPKKALLELEEILKYYKKLKLKYDFTSLNMNEITKTLKTNQS